MLLEKNKNAWFMHMKNALGLQFNGCWVKLLVEPQ